MPLFQPSVPALRRRQVTGRSAFPSSTRNVTNSGSILQIRQGHCFDLLSDVADLSFRYQNAARASASATDLRGLAPVTMKVGLFDGVNNYELFWPNGSRDMLLAPGAEGETVPIFFKGVKGQRLWLMQLMIWSSAPASFPGGNVFAGTGTEYSEWSATALANQTTDYNLVYARPTGGFCVMPPTAILGSSAPGPVVAILGDSISSDGANSYNSDEPNYGWAQAGLADAGIPHINYGQAGFQMAHLAASKPMRAQLFKSLIAGGVTHALVPLATNDFASGRTAAQIDANLRTVAEELSTLGIKTIPVTPQPKTNAANNAVPSGEPNTFTQRRALRDLWRANNGVGQGYYDLALATEASNDLWRADIRAATGFSIVSGGSGYNGYSDGGESLRLPGGGMVGIQAVSSGVITELNAAVGLGGWVTDPPAVVSPTSGIRNNLGNAVSVVTGTGATFSYTGVGPVSSTPDGTHPSAAMSTFIRGDFGPKAAAIFV